MNTYCKLKRKSFPENRVVKCLLFWCSLFKVLIPLDRMESLDSDDEEQPPVFSGKNNIIVCRITICSGVIDGKTFQNMYAMVILL